MRRHAPMLSLIALGFMLLSLLFFMLASAPGEHGEPDEAGQARPVAHRHFFGVDAEALAADAGGITYHGPDGAGELTQAQAMQLIGAPAGLPDDADWMRLTVIGNPARCKAVSDALAGSPELAPWRGKLAVQAYAPSDWAVAESGFKTDGSPTIYVQARSGRVLHRQDDWDGPAPLARALARAETVPVSPAVPTLRGPVAGYDPSKDPDLRRVDPAPTPAPAPGPGPQPQPTPVPNDPDWWKKVPAAVWAAVVAGFALIVVPAPSKKEGS